MKVLKSSIFKKRLCAFGAFELSADDGWKISQAFIDYESKLLVVSTSDENEEHWENSGLGFRTIPTKQYIVDPQTTQILGPSEWSAYFSYEPKELVSEDGNYKLITTRVHEPQNNTDGIEEILIDLSSNTRLSSSTGIAFREERRENALEELYRQKKERQERLDRISAMPTLEEFYQSLVKKLTVGDVVLNYFGNGMIFQLKYIGNGFVLNGLQQTWKYDLNWDLLLYDTIAHFDTAEDFAQKFLYDKTWYLQYSPFNTNPEGESKPLLKRYVVAFFNQLRVDHDFTYEEYGKLNDWENFFYQKDQIQPSEFKQYCGHCKQPVNYYPRYPKYICHACVSLKTTDSEGLELSFFNIGMSGGLKVVYKKDGVVVKEDTTQYEKLCFIEGNRFIATEARFGGIVIQSEN